MNRVDTIRQTKNEQRKLKNFRKTNAFIKELRTDENKGPVSQKI